jgi:hypothetical protein
MSKPRIQIVEDDVFITSELKEIVAGAVDAEIVTRRAAARAKKLIEPSVDLGWDLQSLSQTAEP